MKIRILPILIALCALASCEESARVNCKIELQVNEDGSKPVVGAQASVRYPVGIKVNPGGGFPTDRHQTTRAETDATGKASLTYSTVSSPEGLLWIRKDGYYDTIYRDPKWVKSPGSTNQWISKLEAILKPVKNPLPMFAYDNSGAMEKIANIPELNHEYGFDLMLAEALPPLGKGKTADFKFRLEGFYENKDFFNMKISIKFTNPGDGIVEFFTPQRVGWRESNMPGSQFISDYVAPEEGYISEIARVTAKDKQGKRIEDVDFRKNYYFRSRTVVSPDGRIISAHYGKIYGDFYFKPANKDWGYIASLALITTYFNPTPNDRNVEFDPKRNLSPNGNVLHP